MRKYCQPQPSRGFGNYEVKTKISRYLFVAFT